MTREIRHHENSHQQDVQPRREHILNIPSSPFGQRVSERLAFDLILWRTTVDDRGRPQPRPVWFLWYEGKFSRQYPVPILVEVTALRGH